MNARALFERWKTGFLIYFWVYIAWALGGLIIALPLIVVHFAGAPFRSGFDVLKFAAILPLLISPFIITSDTFRSIVGSLFERAELDQESRP